MSADLLALLARGTLAASAAILVVLLARKPLRDAFGARIAYAFWLIVPFATLSVFLPARRVLVETPAQAGVSGATEAPAQVVNVAPTAVETATNALTSLDLSPLLLGVWLGGALFSFAILVFGQQRFLARIGMRLTGDGYAEGETGPAVVGIVRPRIVLPADFNQRYSETERTLVIAHERAHIEAWDVQINALAAFAQCLNWFNPLFYAARAALRVDQELACDERVMSRHANERRAYAEAMLKTQLATQPIPLGCYWPAIGAKPLKQRIAMLARPRPSTAKRAVGAALCATATFACAAAVWAAQPARPAYADTTRDRGSIVSGALGARLVQTIQDGDNAAARDLIGAGADVDLWMPGDGTPLTMAAREGNRDMVRALVEAGADVNKPAPGDGNPLIMAAKGGDMDMVRLLVEAGADVNGYVHNDETPLINAARHGHLDATRYLIERGANVNFETTVTTYDGRRERRTPLSMARRGGHDEIVRLLQANGARD